MYLNIGDMAFCGKIPIDDKQFSISCDQYRDHDVEIPSVRRFRVVPMKKGKKPTSNWLHIASVQSCNSDLQSCHLPEQG